MGTSAQNRTSDGEEEVQNREEEHEGPGLSEQKGEQEQTDAGALEGPPTEEHPADEHPAGPEEHPAETTGLVY